MYKYYKIHEDALRDLLYDSFKLAALENGGVNNWEWYGMSISDFIKNNGQPNDTDIENLVDREIIESYEEID